MKAKYLAPSVLTRGPEAPGEWRFVDQRLHQECIPPPVGGRGLLSFACPNGHGYCGTLRVGNGFKPGGERPSWKWNGSVTAPTLTPSINCLSGPTPDGLEYGGCGWHSFLTDGEWGKAP
jgi:hypothetical protein